MRREKVIIRHSKGNDGTAIAKVELPHKKEAVLNEGTLEVLLGLGLSPIWQYHKLVGVTCYLKKWRRHASLARVIVDAGPGTNVIFKDGNKLNLRSGNLLVTDQRRGGSKLRYRNGIEPTYHWMKKVIHINE